MSPEPVVSIETITPDQAKGLLTKNTHNRRVVPSRVASLAQTIRRGEWILNGETIKFNGDGSLIDGQHRLAAIAEAGESVRTVVVRGLAQHAQETVDIGSKRGLGDMMTLRGIANGRDCATVAGSVWRWSRGYPATVPAAGGAPVYPMTPAQGFAIWDQHGQGISTSVHTALANKAYLTALGLGRGQLAFLDYLLGSIDRRVADDFLDGLLRGVGLSEDDPRYLLRDRLLRNRAARDHLSRSHVYALIVKAWNHYRKGVRPKILKVSLTEEFPVPDGATGWTDWKAAKEASVPQV